MSIWGLYLLFVKIAVFTFGGGYAMVPLFQEEIVVRHALMSADEFANLVALAQVTPGPIGLNTAPFVGMAEGGLAGAAVATLGVMTPAFVITLAAAAALRRLAKSPAMDCVLSGIRPCVWGVIAAAVFFFADTSVFTAPFAAALKGGDFGVCWQGAAIFLGVLVVQIKWKLPLVWVLVAAAALGWALFEVG